MVCSESPLIYRSSKAINERIAKTEFDSLFQIYKFPRKFTDTIKALEIKFGAEFLTRTTQEYNTLDLPAIEFVIARSSDNFKTADTMNKAISSNIEFQRKSSIGNKTWRKNCRTIAQMSRLEFDEC